MNHTRGDLITIAFGSKGSSWALVTGHNRAGKLLARRWSASHETYGTPQVVALGERRPVTPFPAHGAELCNQLDERDAKRAAELKARVEAAARFPDGSRVVRRDGNGAVTFRGLVKGRSKEGWLWVLTDGERYGSSLDASKTSLLLEE